MSQLPFDWEAIKRSKQYNIRKIERKRHDLKRTMLQQIDGLQNIAGEIFGRSQEYEDWKDNPNELARIIVGR